MRIFVVLVLCMPMLAAADAIMTYEGECPAGTRRGIRNHAEACIPIDCASAACPDASSCVTLCTCRAEREHYGRMPRPTLRDTEIGLCDARGACAEGRVVERKQCEPNAPTPHFDRATHQWVRSPPPAASGEALTMTSEMSSTETTESATMETETMETETMESETMESETTETTTETTSDDGGCSATGSVGSVAWAWLLFFRRRRR